ncbi:MAG: hypothetical protein ACOVQX_03145 [Legionella sp.]
MRLLIPTEPDDLHAVLVKIAMEKRGHEVRLLFTADQPTRQKNSILLTDNSYQWKNSDRYSSFVENDYDVVWWRRARKPFLPKTSVHPDDYQFVTRENHLFYESLTDNLAPNAWWINSKQSAVRANSKLWQLKIANECGMKIPITLCSNDPYDIRDFLLKNEKKGVIYKPLCSNFWFEDNRMKISYTTKITFLDLPSNRILQSTPGIYQVEIKKKYELRVTCFGSYLVAAKLNSQEHAKGKLDWRAIPATDLKIEPYRLPAFIQRKIRKFMSKIGLVFGSIDLIVTNDNEFIFLEVNEQGQFLWLEDHNPELSMLDIFVNFLVKKSYVFKWNKAVERHNLDDYRCEMIAIHHENMQRHLMLNHISSSNDAS